MTENFQTETILQEMLAVLQKHAVSVTTVALNLSFLSSDFEATFPQLKEYKAGVFYRSLTINNIPVTLRIQRRIPFDEIVQWLEKHILPLATRITEEIKQHFEGIQVKLYVNRADNLAQLPQSYSYSITVECHVDDKAEIEGNVVHLSVNVRQFDAASYPKIDAFVAWLVDEESGGDFGYDTVVDLFSGRQEADERTLQEVQRFWPHLYQQLTATIENRLQA